jgi:hypothetical protein
LRAKNDLHEEEIQAPLARAFETRYDQAERLEQTLSDIAQIFILCRLFYPEG